MNLTQLLAWLAGSIVIGLVLGWALNQIDLNETSRALDDNDEGGR